jgi:hypothetical protein
MLPASVRKFLPRVGREIKTHRARRNSLLSSFGFGPANQLAFPTFIHLSTPANKLVGAAVWTDFVG